MGGLVYTFWKTQRQVIGARLALLGSARRVVSPPPPYSAGGRDDYKYK
jgi:hypothetical protein